MIRLTLRIYHLVLSRVMACCWRGKCVGPVLFLDLVGIEIWDWDQVQFLAWNCMSLEYGVVEDSLQGYFKARFRRSTLRSPRCFRHCRGWMYPYFGSLLGLNRFAHYCVLQKRLKMQSKCMLVQLLWTMFTTPHQNDGFSWWRLTWIVRPWWLSCSE